jgi:hypothetical protein
VIGRTEPQATGSNACCQLRRLKEPELPQPSFSGMDEGTEKLIARANAAIVEAARLIQTNLAWQEMTRAQLKRMKLRACFQPKSYRFYSPIYLPNHPYRPQDEHARRTEKTRGR